MSHTYIKNRDKYANGTGGEYKSECIRETIKTKRVKKACSRVGGEATIKLHTTLDAHMRAALSLIMHKEMSRSTHAYISIDTHIYCVQNKYICI